ncbi:MAG: 30S ribosomal protein S9 [Solirubrobacterales bacterium]
MSAEERARLEAEEEEKARREAELAAAQEADPAAASRAPAKMEKGARFLATGKRKSSIARVTLLPGNGKIEINKRSIEEFFPRPLHQTMVKQPLAVSGYEGNVDVRVRVHGGGISGQAGAVRHGVARALTEIDAELRPDLKRRGFLTRDARVKERRKAGLKKARKRPQFSKR